VDRPETEATPTTATPQPTSKPKPIWTPGETIAIASIPAIGYWFAFQYERGYCEHFAIPQQFISLSMISIMGVVASWATAAYTGLLLVYLFKEHRVTHPIGRRVLIAVLVVLTSCLTLTWPTAWWHWLIWIGSLSLFAVFTFIMPWVYARQAGVSYREMLERLDSDVSPSPQKRSRPLGSLLRTYVGRNFLSVDLSVSRFSFGGQIRRSTPRSVPRSVGQA
jgi:hypothetical protein